MKFMNQISANHPWVLIFSQAQIGSSSRREKTFQKHFSKHGAAQNTTIKVYIWVCVYFSCISVTIVELNLVLKFRCGSQVGQEMQFVSYSISRTTGIFQNHFFFNCEMKLQYTFEFGSSLLITLSCFYYCINVDYNPRKMHLSFQIQEKIF